MEQLLSSSRTKFARIAVLTIGLVSAVFVLFCLYVIWFDNEFGRVLVTRIFFTLFISVLIGLPYVCWEFFKKISTLSYNEGTFTLSNYNGEISVNKDDLVTNKDFRMSFPDFFRMTRWTKIKTKNPRGEYVVLNKSLHNSKRKLYDIIYEIKFEK